MKFSITIENATVSTIAKDEYEMLRHIEACFLAQGYSSDTFSEYLAHYLELYHRMTVMLEKDYTKARNAEVWDTEEGEEEEEPDWHAPVLKSEDEYNAGYNDGYNGDLMSENQSAAYRAGWYEGHKDSEPGGEEFEKI